MKYNRTEIAGNIGFSSIIDSKFKTAYLSVRFITALSRKNAADNSVGIGMISASSSAYKTIAELSEKLSLLYGASLSSSAKKRGDIQILSLGASWLDDKYTLENEKISDEMLEIVCGCLFAPNVCNEEFDAESFKITKKDLLDRIDSEINNKRGYALSRAAETAFKGEPAENSCYGTREAAEVVTAKTALQAYNELLKTAQIEIFYVAPNENNQIEKRLADEFGKIKRKPIDCSFINPSLLKTEVDETSDTLDVNQCKMVLVFKTSSDDIYAVRMMNTILGETPVSKLFMNVREKLSLCYYCASRFISSKKTLFIDSGIEKENIEKAKKEILYQLDEIRKGNITEEEYDNAIMSLDNTLSSVGDTPSSYTSWYFERFCENNIITPQQQLQNYKAVTKERIIKAAESISLDSVYIMFGKEAE